MGRFEEVEHTADWAFRVQGRDLRELFQRAAQAMCEMQGHEVGKNATVTRQLQVEGFDRETLLVNWLNELLYLQETAGQSYSEFEILEISDTRLRARLRGWPGNQRTKLIKAVTFHDLKLQPTAEGWEATVVLDV